METTPATGQIWGDIIPKKKGRTVKVVRVENDLAYCTLITEIGGEPAAGGQKIEIPLDDFVNFEMLHDPTEEMPNDGKEPFRPPVVGEMADWFEKNPIRVWLKENNSTQETLAVLVGVSVISLRHWMNGRKPNDEHRNKVAVAMNLSLSEFDEKWDLWLARKPSPQ